MRCRRLPIDKSRPRKYDKKDRDRPFPAAPFPCFCINTPVKENRI